MNHQAKNKIAASATMARKEESNIRPATRQFSARNRVSHS
jgi:hypothetical protein